MPMPIKRVFKMLSACMLVGLAGCSPLKVINAITPTGGYDKQQDIAYGSDPRQRLDIYTPHDANAAAPVVLFFYGGTWTTGAREDYKFVGQALASRGIVAVVADYRLYPQVRYPGILQDSAHALAWTLSNISRFGGDPDHVFVMGHSAGAYNAAMIALDNSWLMQAENKQDVPKDAAQNFSQNQQATRQSTFKNPIRGWIGLAGPYDFLPIENPEAKPVFFFPNSPPESQPINHVTAAAPRALLIAALNDKLVNPQRNTRGMTEKLRAVGVKVETIYYDRYLSHPTLVATLAWPLRWWAPVLDNVEQFVKSDGGRKVSVQKNVQEAAQ